MFRGKDEQTEFRAVPPDGAERAGAVQDLPVKVKMWTGVGAIVVAVSIPGVDPDDMECTIGGNCLQIRGAGLRRDFCHDIQLPCSIENQPIIISQEKSEGTVYLMLKK